MVKPRVFISHSSEEEASDARAAYALEMRNALADALQQHGFEVLLDRRGLKAGDRWRDVINGWLGACDAAVPIVSRKALESPWVAYEVCVMAFRRAQADGFRLVPVHVDLPADLATWSRVDPTQILENQGVQAQWHAGLADASARQHAIHARVQEVLAALHGLVAVAEHPIQRAVQRVRDLIAALPGDVAGSEADKIAFATDGWTAAADPKVRLAYRMVTLGLDGCGPTLNRLKAHFRGPTGTETLQDVIDVLASTWVDVEAVRVLETVFAAGRAVASNARDEQTARFYVWARTEAPPSRGWLIEYLPWTSAGGTDVDAQVASYVEMVYRTLADQLKQEGRAAVAQKLRDLAKVAQRRAFVAMPAAGVDVGIVDELRRQLPDVGLFLLECDPEKHRRLIEKGRITYLQPVLRPEEEPCYLEHHRSTCNAILDRP